MLGIVVYPVGTWEGFHRRPMLEALARNLRGKGFLLVVEPPVALLDSGHLRNWRPAARAVLRGTQQLAENIWLARPTASRRSQAGFTASARTVRAALGRISPRPDRVAALVFRPEQNALLGLVGEDAVIYECYDEYRMDRQGREIPGVRSEEQKLLSSAEVVLTTSRPLYESRRRDHAGVHYTPNGVDCPLFEKTRDPELAIAEDMRAWPPPVVGYLGTFTDFLDYRGLEDTAIASPGRSFVFVGPVVATEAAEQLGKLPNVHFLGPRARYCLPSYLKGMDATMCLLRVSEYTEAARPLTVMEYLAAGKPVVVRRTRSLTDLGDVVYFAETKEEVIACIERALAEDSPELAERRQARAREYDWDVLTKKTAEIILECCG
jgi:glycosyltransferase involved in cell wall biosynthesis